MINKSAKFIRAVLLLTITVWLSLAGISQNKPAPAEKKTKAANESCDGALNIVPSKPMTFARKRRPAPSEAKPSAPAEAPKEAKSEKQQSGDGQ